MKALIMENVADFVQMDPMQTVNLCDVWFDSDYELIAKELLDHKDLAFSFLNTVVTQNEPQIIKEYNNSVRARGDDYGPSERFISLLLIFVEILCEKKFRSRIVEYVSRNYFPVDQSLKICVEKEALEASAVLNRRKGSYQESVELYNKVLIELCAHKLIHTLFVERNIGFRDPETTNEHILRFDDLLLNILKICEKYGSSLGQEESEKLWLFSIKQLFQIKPKVYEMLAGGSDSEED
jgi:hypothetical protein